MPMSKCTGGTVSEKLAVLSAVAHELNGRQITWAIGASLLLYFKKKVQDFRDIDIMVSEDDVDVLMKIGELQPANPRRQYKTRHFLEFMIDGVDVDVMAGFVIARDGVDHECPFDRSHIAEYVQFNGESIPLQSLEEWRQIL